MQKDYYIPVLTLFALAPVTYFTFRARGLKLLYKTPTFIYYRPIQTSECNKPPVPKLGCYKLKHLKTEVLPHY